MINEAIEFAAKAHEGQLRKGTKKPYICLLYTSPYRESPSSARANRKRVLQTQSGAAAVCS